MVNEGNISQISSGVPPFYRNGVFALPTKLPPRDNDSSHFQCEHGALHHRYSRAVYNEALEAKLPGIME